MTNTDTLAAAGSLVATRPANGARLRLGLELVALFGGVPLALLYAIQSFRISLFVMLLPVLLGVVLYLLWDRTFSLKDELSRRVPARAMAWILLLFAVIGGLIAGWVYLERPGDFLNFPTFRPGLWLAVMVLYPLLSALPQELVFRTFFFHRYGPLFGENRWAAIVTNGVLFGLAHIMFGTVASVVLSGLLGGLLAYRYSHTRSIWAAWLEHVLYGNLVFTVGLGRYFFTGVSMF